MQRFSPPADDTLSAAYRAAQDAIVTRRGRLPEPHTVLLHSTPVALAFEHLSEALRQGVLPAWALEIAHLTAAQRMNCAYQWGSHASKAVEAGLSAACIEGLREGRVANVSEETDAFCVFAQALLAGLSVPDQAFEAVSRRYGLRGAAEFAAQCGFAMLVASTLKVRFTADHQEQVPDRLT